MNSSSALEAERICTSLLAVLEWGEGYRELSFYIVHFLQCVKSGPKSIKKQKTNKQENNPQLLR